jgi:hypothetical protein
VEVDTDVRPLGLFPRSVRVRRRDVLFWELVRAANDDDVAVGFLVEGRELDIV